MADLTGWLGPVASLITAVGALPMANLLQQRGEARIRASIEASMKTLTEVENLKADNKITLKKRLETSLESDFAALERVTSNRNQERERNWATLGVSVFFAAVLTVPLWFMWKPVQWWTWLIFAALAFLAAFLVLLGIFAWAAGPSEQQQRKRAEKLKSG